MRTGLPHVAAVTGGPGGQLVVADSQGNILVSTNGTAWSQPSVPPTSSDGRSPPLLMRPLLLCSQGRLWLGFPLTSSLLLAPQAPRCHSWAPLPLTFNQGKLYRLWGGEREAYSGRLFLSSDPSSLLWTKIHGNKIRSVPLPPGEEIHHLAALPSALWLLTTSGSIFIRSSEAWAPLHLGQLGSHRIVSLSIGEDQVWAASASPSLSSISSIRCGRPTQKVASGSDWEASHLHPPTLLLPGSKWTGRWELSSRLPRRQAGIVCGQETLPAACGQEKLSIRSCHVELHGWRCQVFRLHGSKFLKAQVSAKQI